MVVMGSVVAFLVVLMFGVGQSACIGATTQA
jgi:hypothetical protein